eukprot:TRINITY_DN45016_c0_g1_i1.p1 TRINITY_DN45016_c0_g1~~TRINITY_DN45016_c0_g1_i1.p1  ORF type:complete len:399 (-),score=60.07 TRINITY_DN45016_c0_g1_i1:104-1300(-)
MFGLVGPTVTVATNAGKAINLLRSLSDVSEEGKLLWHALDSLESPLQLAMCFQRRHTTMHFFHGPVLLCQEVIEECERVLARDDGEDSRPESRDGWVSWLSHKKKGLQRKDALPRLTARLGVCMNSLQLAFSAASALHPPTARPLRQPFELAPAVVEFATELVHEFEMGRRRRVLCCSGAFMETSSSSLQGRETDQDWCHVGTHTLWIELSSADETYQLCWRPLPKVVGLDEDSDEDEATPAPCSKHACDLKIRCSLKLDPTSLVCKRMWADELRSRVSKKLEPDLRAPFVRDQIAYNFADGSGWACVMFFEVPRRSLGLNADGAEETSTQAMSAEMFELVLSMLLLKQGREDMSCMLADVCDFESRSGCSKLLEVLEEKVGAYNGMDQSWRQMLDTS